MALPPSLIDSLKTISVNFSFLPSIAINLGIAARGVGRLVELEGGEKADALKFFAAEDLKEAESEVKPEKVSPTPIKPTKKTKPLKEQFSIGNIVKSIEKFLGIGLLLGIVISQFWDDIVNSVKEWAGELWETIKEKFDGFVTDIKEWFTETFKNIGEKVSTFVNEWIIQPVKNWFNGVMDWIANKIGQLKGYVTGPLEYVKDLFSKVVDLANKLGNFISDNIKKAKEFVEGGIDAVKNFFGFGPKEKPKKVEPPAPPDEGRAKAAAASRKARLKKKATPAPSTAPQPETKVPPKTEPSAAAAAPTAEKVPSKQEMKPVKIDSNTGKKAVLAEMDSRGITDKTQRASIMAQIGHESGGFQYLSENLNYSENGLNSIFGKYFKKAGRDTKEYARNPYKIANVVYGGRMGNTAPDDGWRYRGRGFLQLTGKNNYNKFGFGGSPDQVSEPKNAAKTALDYMMGYKGDWADIKKITKFVNGGYIGLDDRKKHFEEYLADASITEVKSGPSLASGGVSGASTSVASGQRQQAKPQTPVIVNAPSSTTNVVKQNVNRVAQTQKDAGKALTARIA